MDHNQEYSKSFSDLTNGKTYILEITAFHSDSCNHEKRKTLKFNVTYPCLNKPCHRNRTCQRDGWLGDFKCDCSPGFRNVNGSICEGVTIQFTRSTYNVYENKKPVVEIKVTSGQIISPVTIDVLYIVSTGPSSAGNDDFVPKTQNITFQPRETGPKLIEIDIVDDSIVEPPETFKVSLSTSATSVTVGKPAIVNISDNDDSSSSSRNVTEVIIVAIIVPVLLLLSIFVIVVLIIVRRRDISRNNRGRQGHVPASKDQPSSSAQHEEIGLDNKYAELNNK